MPNPSLYGIKNSNRKNHWGKNQFNSSFPASLACWMRDNGHNPVYIHHSKGEVSASDTSLTFDDLFGSSESNDKLTFDFESKFEPYNDYVHDSFDGIDLVVKHGDSYLQPLEVKLTVVPDSTTYSKEEKDWGAEIVIRPVSVMYAALSIYDAIKGDKDEALKCIRKTALAITDWANISEISSHREDIVSSLVALLDKYEEQQRPLILQPIWKTLGQQPALADNAFDIFVWSNMAICRMFINQAAIAPKGAAVGKVSRYTRASAKLLKCLYDLLSTGVVRKSDLDRMALGHQTDKEFSAAGRLTNIYMSHPRVVKPAVEQSKLNQIILNGGQEMLSPERRFDATIYFTARSLFEK